MRMRTKCGVLAGMFFLTASLALAENKPEPAMEEELPTENVQPENIKPESPKAEATKPGKVRVARAKSNAVAENEPAEGVKKMPGGVRVKDPATPEGGAGDTYNFYFQKSDGPNKVQQGNGSQNVEQRPTETSAHTQAPVKDKEPVVDIFLGLLLLPGKSATGFTIGGDFLPRSAIGVRLGVFAASGSSDSSHTQSPTSIFDSTETSTKNSYYGGDVALTFNLAREGSVKVAPLVGLLFLNDKNTTTTTTNNFWGANDGSSSNSHFRIYPYVGVSGTVAFTRHFGMNVMVALPTVPSYLTTSLNLIFRI